MNSYEPTLAGWIFMLVSCGTMIVWTAWCYYRVLTAPHPTDPGYTP